MSDKQRVEEVDNTRTTSCGLFSYRPPWLQRFATPHCYIALYSTIGILLGVTFAYLTVVLSTIEKRFGLQSKESAWLYAGNEISQVKEKRPCLSRPTFFCRKFIFEMFFLFKF